MAKAKETKKAKGGVSLDPEDAVAGGGLFGAGEATAASHRFGMFDYNGKRKAVPALLVTFERGDEEHIESYTVGAGWKPSEDGLTLVPKAGQTGLGANTKAMLYFLALRDECGKQSMPKGMLANDVSVLDGITGELTRKPLEKVEGSEKAGSLLVFTSVDAAPWLKGTVKKKAKGKAKDEDDDEEEEEDDDDAEDSDDDEDEDEPASKKKKKGAKKPAPAKGKKKPAADDDDDEEEDESDDDDDDDVDEDIVEAATEGLIAALEDGPLKIAKIGDLVLAAVKKHPKKKAIAAYAATPAFLKKEIGWSFNGKVARLEEADED